MTEHQIKLMLKALIVSKKGGIPLKELDIDYKEEMGEPIPYLTVGFSSLKALLTSMSEVLVFKNECGLDMVKCVEGGKSGHINDLVSKQKSATKKRKKGLFQKQFNEPYRPSGHKPWFKQNYKTSFKNQNKKIDYNQATQLIKRHNLAKRWNEAPRPSVKSQKPRPLRQLQEANHGWSYSTNQARQWEIFCTKPLFKHHQLIGDDFLLRIGCQILGAQGKMIDGLLVSCGLCKSGQTIPELTVALQRGAPCLDRVLLMIGMMDAMMGAPLEEMTLCIEDLLYTLLVLRQVKCVRFLTLLPPLNVIPNSNHWRVFENFNRYLFELPKYYSSVKVLHTWPMFLDHEGFVRDHLFEIEPSTPVGHDFVLHLLDGNGCSKLLHSISDWIWED